MIIDTQRFVRTEKGTVEVRPFMYETPPEVLLAYRATETLTEAEMKADIAPVKEEVLRKIREHIPADDNVLDRLIFITRPVTLHTPRNKRNLIGQIAGAATELLFIT